MYYVRKRYTLREARLKSFFWGKVVILDRVEMESCFKNITLNEHLKKETSSETI